MPKAPLPTSSPLPRPSRRLLEALAAPGATARENAARPGFLAVAVVRAGITTVGVSVPHAAAAPLVAGGYAAWQGADLVASADGRSYLRRLESGPADPFGAQHRDLAREVRAANEAPVTVDAGESPLTWLARRRDREGRPLIDPCEFEAGERLRRDITTAQLLPSVTSNWAAHGAGSRNDPGRVLLPSEVAMAARQRVERALDAVGPEFSGLLLDTCGFVKRLETIETERGWPPRSAKIVLRMALGRLARHYGLAASATGPARSAMRHWGEANYRPAISPDEG